MSNPRLVCKMRGFLTIEIPAGSYRLSFTHFSRNYKEDTLLWEFKNTAKFCLLLGDSDDIHARPTFENCTLTGPASMLLSSPLGAGVTSVTPRAASFVKYFFD